MIAIDIVLLPPKKIKNIAIKINKEAYSRNKGRFPLGQDDFVPHISLTLGIIEEKNIEIIKRIIEDINFKGIDLEILGVEFYNREDGNRGFLKINVTDELRELHSKVFEKVSRYLVKYENADMLVEGDKTGISDFSRMILNNFENFAYEKYNPHITLCCYDPESDLDFPIEFKVNEIALFQVGDGCTCRRRLYSFGGSI